MSQPTDAGVAKVVLALARHQAARGLAVAVACPDEGPLADEVRAAGLTHVPWRATRSPVPGLLRQTRELRSIVRSVAPQVVHLHSSKAGLCGRLAPPAGTSIVFQPHAWSDQSLTGPVRRAARLWESLADRRSALTVCGSAAEAAHGEALGARHVVVVPNGVDPSWFAPRDRDEARAALAIPPGAPLLLCVGRLSPQKGQDILLGLWPKIRRREPRARLALVGAGPDEAELRRLADAHVIVDTTCDDPRSWYAASDVVVAPSRWEGAALVPLEAMSMARSVVGFDVGGLAAVVGSARTAPGTEAHRLLDLVLERVVDPALADGEGRRNRDRVLRDYDVRETVARITAATLGLVG